MVISPPTVVPIPVDEFHRVIKGSHHLVGQRAPLNRRLTGGRVFFPRQDHGRAHGRLTVMYRQAHHLPVLRTPRESDWSG